jgi:O-methyltransferase involved in polyketide biosynthesis
MNTKNLGWTAQATAAIWEENHVPGAKAFATWRGKLLNMCWHVGGAAIGLRGRNTMANLLLVSRHLGINAILDNSTNVQQVVELAAGLSSRGQEWSQHHVGSYIEVDQAHVVAKKREIIDKDIRPKKARHFLVEVDLLSPNLVEKLKPIIERNQKTSIICEGLTAYLNEESTTYLLHNIKDLADWIGEDIAILIDFYVRPDVKKQGRLAKSIARSYKVAGFLRAPMPLFLSDRGSVENLLNKAGFKTYKIWTPDQLAKAASSIVPAIDLFYVVEIVKHLTS